MVAVCNITLIMGEEKHCPERPFSVLYRATSHSNELFSTISVELSLHPFYPHFITSTLNFKKFILQVSQPPPPPPSSGKSIIILQKIETLVREILILTTSRSVVKNKTLLKCVMQWWCINLRRSTVNVLLKNRVVLQLL